MWNEKHAAPTTFFADDSYLLSVYVAVWNEVGHFIAHSTFKTCSYFFKRMKPAYILDLKHFVYFAWKISPIASDDWVWTQKISKKRSDEYVTIDIYDHEVTWNESISDSFDITLSNNGTKINLADIINVWGCSGSTQTQQHAWN